MPSWQITDDEVFHVEVIHNASTEKNSTLTIKEVYVVFWTNSLGYIPVYFS